jgi:uncharacterized membrane protein YkoI
MNMNMNRKRIAMVIAGAAVLTAGTVGAARAMSGDDNAQERPIPAADLEQAERAALAETGGGKVTATEINDEESKYEVEVTLEGGTQVDVQLDEDFDVVGSASDGADDD